MEHQEDLRNKNVRFSSASHRMVFLGETKETDEITTFDRYLVEHKKEFENNWNFNSLDR